MILFNTVMQKEKIALAAIVIIIIVLLSALIVTSEDVFKNLFGEKKEISDTVEVGDCVDVNYIGRFQVNNTVFDTSYENIAKEAGIYNDNKTYQPLKIFVDPDGTLTLPEGYENYSSSMIPGFIKGLIGMKEGENKTVVVPPEDAYGDWNLSLAEQLFNLYFGSPHIPRYSSNNITTTIPKVSLLDLNSTLNLSALYVNQTFDYIEGVTKDGEPAVWQIQILNISDQNVTIKNLIENGTIIKTEGLWDRIIIIENETKYIVKAEPELNKTYGAPHSWMKVISFNDTEVVVAINMKAEKPEFIGQTLVFDIEVIKLYKTSD